MIYIAYADNDSLLAWGAFINTMTSNGLSDIILTAVVLTIFVFGFIFGLFEIGRLPGITLLGVIGGLAVGIRVVLMREDLLVPIFIVDWVLVALFGFIGLVLVIFKQRAGIVSFSSSSSSVVLTDVYSRLSALLLP